VQLSPTQLRLVPVHANAPHDGLPGYPSGAVVHVPSAPAPSAFAHTSQGALQPVLQHTPSLQ
jgi:hypothetical protein